MAPTQIKLSYASIPSSAKPTHPLQAYQAIPTSDKRLPTILIIHEVLGMNDNIRNVAHRFAQTGYFALAVDLFTGGGRAVRRAQALVGMAKRQPIGPLLTDLQAALTYIHQHADADPKRLAVVGFGMGGNYALQMICSEHRHLSLTSEPLLKAAAIFYAFNPRPLQISSRTCPIIASYPEGDITTGDAEELHRALEDQHVEHEIKVYPGTLHSFCNDQIAAYNHIAAEDAWERMLTFFNKHVNALSGGE